MPAALQLRPELGMALARGRDETAHGAIVSGSGPSCLFLCESRSHAAEVAAAVPGTSTDARPARSPAPGSSPALTTHC